jgi:hypothetical protein
MAELFQLRRKRVHRPRAAEKVAKRTRNFVIFRNKEIHFLFGNVGKLNLNGNLNEDLHLCTHIRITTSPPLKRPLIQLGDIPRIGSSGSESGLISCGAVALVTIEEGSFQGCIRDYQERLKHIYGYKNYHIPNYIFSGGAQVRMFQ